MDTTSSRFLLWAPRILGILVAGFIGAFALDAIGEGAPDFLMHAAPSLMLFLVVLTAWRWPWIGGVVFIALALLYAATTMHRWDWILTISGPLLLVGGLFLWSWRSQRRMIL